MGRSLFRPVCCPFSFFFSYFLRFNFEIGAMNMERLIYQMLFVIPVTIIGLLFINHLTDYQHTAARDIQRVLYAQILSSGLLTIISLFTRGHGPTSLIWSLLVIFIHFILCVFLMTWTRLLVRLIYQNLRLYNKKEVRVMIMGLENWDR